MDLAHACTYINMQLHQGATTMTILGLEMIDLLWFGKGWRANLCLSLHVTVQLFGGNTYKQTTLTKCCLVWVLIVKEGVEGLMLFPCFFWGKWRPQSIWPQHHMLWYSLNPHYNLSWKLLTQLLVLSHIMPYQRMVLYCGLRPMRSTIQVARVHVQACKIKLQALGTLSPKFLLNAFQLFSLV